MSLSLTHTTVLLHETVDAVLSAAPTAPGGGCLGTFVDATFGRGGHARLLLSRLAPEGRLIAFDKDAEAVAEAAGFAVACRQDLGGRDRALLLTRP